MNTRTTQRQKFWGKEFLQSGLNVADNPIMVPFNQMTLAENILVGNTFARRKRGGQAYFNLNGEDATANYPLNPKNSLTAPPPILGGTQFFYYDINGSSQSIIAIRQDENLWAIGNRLTAGTLVGNGLPTTGKICFQPFENKLYWCSSNTNEGYNKYDPIANTLTPATPPPDGIPKRLSVHRGRMWCSGVEGFPYRLYYSEPFNGDNWATTPFGSSGGPADPGSLDLDSFGDPEGITGHVSFQGNLYVFMRRAVYEISGSTINDFVVRPISREVGCINHHTIVPVQNDVIYASERGVLTLNSTDKVMGSQYAYLSRDIAPIWNELVDRNLNDQYHAIFDEIDNLYMLSVPSLGSQTNDQVLVYNLQSGAGGTAAEIPGMWFTWKGINARCLFKVLVNNIPRVVAGREDGILSLTGEAERSDFGSAFNSKFKTGVLYPSGMADQQHIWKSFTILQSTDSPANIIANYIIDSTNSGTRNYFLDNLGDKLTVDFILGQSALSSGIYRPRTFALDGEGYGLQLEINMNDIADVEIYGFLVESMPTKMTYE